MGDKHATERKSSAKKNRKKNKKKKKKKKKKKNKNKKKKNITIFNEDTTPQGHSKLMSWITATSQYCFVYNHCRLHDALPILCLARISEVIL